MQRDYDGWAENGAKGWAFADVLPVFKSQEDWEGGANAWRGAGGPIHIRRPKDPHPTAPAFIDAARETEPLKNAEIVSSTWMRKSRQIRRSTTSKTS